MYDDRYINRDGFLFTSVTHPGNVYDGIIINNIQRCDTDFKFPNSSRTLEEHIELINKFQIEKAEIYTSNLDFLFKTPSLKHLSITVYPDGCSFDYTPLYAMREIKSIVIVGHDFKPLIDPIDYSRINGLLDVRVSGKGHLNFEKVKTLKTLAITGWKQSDLKNLFQSKELDTLRMIQCGMSSLDGIEKSDSMQCVYLHYNRSLQDISALQEVKNTLKVLEIENCSNIKDLSVLAKLENLELLRLSGSNVLPNLNFIEKMKNLKTFTFNMNVLSGDLTPCLNLSYVYSQNNRKHFNLKNKDLPKNEYVRGNENIEEWRRME